MKLQWLLDGYRPPPFDGWSSFLTLLPNFIWRRKGKIRSLEMFLPRSWEGRTRSMKGGVRHGCPAQTPLPFLLRGTVTWLLTFYTCTSLPGSCFVAFQGINTPWEQPPVNGWWDLGYRYPNDPVPGVGKLRGVHDTSPIPFLGVSSHLHRGNVLDNTSCIGCFSSLLHFPIPLWVFSHTFQINFGCSNSCHRVYFWENSNYNKSFPGKCWVFSAYPWSVPESPLSLATTSVDERKFMGAVKCLWAGDQTWQGDCRGLGVQVKGHVSFLHEQL